MPIRDDGLADQSELWNQALAIISDQLSKPAFDTWFSQTSAFGNEHRLTIVSEETLKSEWLEVRYSKLIREAIHKVTGNPSFEFRFETKH